MSLCLARVEQGRLAASTDAGREFPWWSITKIALAAASLALARDGRLALDAPLAPHPFTLRQLLQHRAGLTDYGALPDYHAAVARGDAPWPVPELLARTEAARLRYAPGEGWAYSNIGYLHVRQQIEAAAAEPLAEALPRLVLRPLGLARGRLALAPEALAGIERIGEPGNAPYHPGWVYHGLLVGPLGEAALLVERLLTGALLPAPLLAAMCESHRLDAGAANPQERPWREPGYGLGLQTGLGSSGGAVLGHSGGGPGSVIAAYHRPAHGSAAACLAGDDPGAVERAAFAALGA